MSKGIASTDITITHDKLQQQKAMLYSSDAGIKVV